MHLRRTSKASRRTRAAKLLVPETDPEKTEHHKGDQHSGGGGGVGEGGKKRRPPLGWEKGDVVRDVDTHHDPYEVPIKPGRDPVRKAAQNATKRARRRQRAP